MLNRFLRTDIGEIRIFSRDEKKQDDMRHDFQARMPEVANKIKFFIGDVRSLQSCKSVMPGVDYIFHAAALKQVPSCEFFPMEAVQTNVIGTDNVLTAAIEAKVKSVICLSTDKAAYPINAMGITKAIDMGDFYRVPADNRDLNYDKYFTEGNAKRAEIEEFNSDNTYRLNLEETKAKIASLEYIKRELSGEGNLVK